MVSVMLELVVLGAISYKVWKKSPEVLGAGIGYVYARHKWKKLDEKGKTLVLLPSFSDFCIHYNQSNPFSRNPDDTPGGLLSNFVEDVRNYQQNRQLEERVESD